MTSMKGERQPMCSRGDLLLQSTRGSTMSFGWSLDVSLIDEIIFRERRGLELAFGHIWHDGRSACPFG